jgi:tetratricopeptide (TPR) repeat protein
MLNSGNELEKIATTDQQRGYAFFVQGYAQYAKKNYTESESLINQSLALSPENPTAYAILSAIENTKNNFDKMKTYAQKCIAIAADMGWCPLRHRLYQYRLSRSSDPRV